MSSGVVPPAEKREDIRDWIALSLVAGLGSASFRRLIEVYGSPAAVLVADTEDLKRRGGVREDVATRIASGIFLADPELEYMRTTEAGARLVTISDPEYPILLKEISDAPPLLYLKGRSLPQEAPIVAIVGSRTPTSYGLRAAEFLAGGLAKEGITVASGLALGIDSAAHRGCLNADGFTLAVMGTGIDRVYPSANRDLFEKIAKNGCVITEFPTGTPPEARNFPRRNRIISGLSRAVVVVEAAKKSGSLITAAMALEQGREVFAVPGSIGSPRSAGTHFLLRNGAALCEKAQDIMSVLGIAPTELRDSGGSEDAVTDRFDEEEGRLLALMEPYPLHVDVFIERSGMEPGKVLAALLSLELKGAVRQLPGKLFVKAS